MGFFGVNFFVAFWRIIFLYKTIFVEANKLERDFKISKDNLISQR